jgi:DNA-directed RNA polymerase specialized sigma24 family protein
VTDPFAPLRAIADIPDLVERGKALSDALKKLPDVQAELRQARQDVVLALREQGWSHAQVAAEFGLTRSRAQQIAEGKTTTAAGTHPRKA